MVIYDSYITFQIFCTDYFLYSSMIYQTKSWQYWPDKIRRNWKTKVSNYETWCFACIKHCKGGLWHALRRTVTGPTMSLAFSKTRKSKIKTKEHIHTAPGALFHLFQLFAILNMPFSLSSSIRTKVGDCCPMQDSYLQMWLVWELLVVVS